MISEKGLTFGTDFTLSDDWVTLAATLQLNDTVGEDASGIGSKRTYLLWLWM